MVCCAQQAWGCSGAGGFRAGPGPASSTRGARWRGSAGGVGCLPRGWGVLSGGRHASSRGRVAVSPVRRMPGPAGRCTGPPAGPAGPAAADHRASPSSAGLACCQAARAHGPVTGVAGGSPQPVVLGSRGRMAERGGTAVNSRLARTRHGRVFGVLFILERELAAGPGPWPGSGTARRPAWRPALRGRRMRGRARNCWRCPGRLVRLSTARSSGR